MPFPMHKGLEHRPVKLHLRYRARPPTCSLSRSSLGKNSAGGQSHAAGGDRSPTAAVAVALFFLLRLLELLGLLRRQRRGQLAGVAHNVKKTIIKNRNPHG